MLRLLIVIILFLLAAPLFAGDAPEIDDQTRAIAQELRCVVCQNLSVADSPSEMAQQMRAVIREQVASGKTPEEVRSFFVSKYGEWVLLSPDTQGFSLLVWVLPFAVLILGIVAGLWFLRRWSLQRNKREVRLTDPALLQRVRSEAPVGRPLDLDREDTSARSQLLQERERLYGEIKELEFDFQAGKFSRTDYENLKEEIEGKAAAVLEQLDNLPATQPARAEVGDRKAALQPTAPQERTARGYRGWQLAVGGVFLLVFGLTLGILLTNSLRSRTSEQDSVTGDFLTGTSGGETGRLLQEGKAAFAKQDWPKAIEVFKKVLAADPNQPEAHAYMGLILVQAGHADGALMAFDKALSQAPNLPMALWGKGMTLYQAKQDYAGAKEVLERLVQSMPAGAERGEVEKVLAEMPKAGQKPRQELEKKTAASSTDQQITGKITVDSKLKDKVNNKAALFIIARSAEGGGGPPLAVRKVERPAFPLSYSLGAENVMMQGRPFSGKVTITVRLDKDGNAMTREAGNLTGEYKKNPVEVGSKNVDIVLDQVTK
jgi:cytochrome c-type biogenesis protein CcmH